MFDFYIVATAITHGHGKGPVHLDHLQCTGEEMSLFNCSHDGVGIHDCAVNDYARVICYNGM